MFLADPDLLAEDALLASGSMALMPTQARGLVFQRWGDFISEDYWSFRALCDWRFRLGLERRLWFLVIRWLLGRGRWRVDGFAT